MKIDTEKAILFILGKMFREDYQNNHNKNFNDWIKKNELQVDIKQFLVTYRYTNRTDAALHQDEIEAINCVEACNKVCENHNFEVEWHTVTEN